MPGFSGEYCGLQRTCYENPISVPVDGVGLIGTSVVAFIS